MPNPAPGAAPEGVQGEVQAATWVRNMFSDIAPRYDLLNHLLSFNIDRSWRKALLKNLRPVLAQPQARILDLCCGTGDVMLDLLNVAQGTVMGADFCHPMLVSAAKKATEKRRAAHLFEADGLTLPIADNALDAVSIAFGFRNLANYAAGLKELHRVLHPGGSLAVLEFSHPVNPLIKVGYGLYSRAILPLVGSLVSGCREAYSYLPESIGKFPRAEAFRQMIERSGFEAAEFQLLSGGIAALHTGTKV